MRRSDSEVVGQSDAQRAFVIPSIVAVGTHPLVAAEEVDVIRQMEMLRLSWADSAQPTTFLVIETVMMYASYSTKAVAFNALARIASNLA